MGHVVEEGKRSGEVYVNFFLKVPGTLKWYLKWN
jgi:hypothetical protein